MKRLLLAGIASVLMPLSLAVASPAPVSHVSALLPGEANMEDVARVDRDETSTVGHGVHGGAVAIVSYDKHGIRDPETGTFFPDSAGFDRRGVDNWNAISGKALHTLYGDYVGTRKLAIVSFFTIDDASNEVFHYKFVVPVGGWRFVPASEVHTKTDSFIQSVNMIEYAKPIIAKDGSTIKSRIVIDPGQFTSGELIAASIHGQENDPSIAFEIESLAASMRDFSVGGDPLGRIDLVNSKVCLGTTSVSIKDVAGKHLDAQPSVALCGKHFMIESIEFVPDHTNRDVMVQGVGYPSDRDGKAMDNASRRTTAVISPSHHPRPDVDFEDAGSPSHHGNAL